MNRPASGINTFRLEATTLRRTVLLMALAWTLLVGHALWRTHSRRLRQAHNYAAAQARVYYDTDRILHTRGLLLSREAGNGPVRVAWKGLPGTVGAGAPDDWETSALAQLAGGATEVKEVLVSDGERFLRWMGPAHWQVDCGSCHDWRDTGHAALRGGVSVTMALKPMLAVSASSWGRQLTAHVVAWILGMVGLFVACRFLIRGLAERDRVTGNLASALQATETIVENVPFGMVIVGQDKVVRQVNRIAEEILGKDASEVVGKVCHQNICPAQEDSCPILDLGQVVDNSERMVLGADGRQIPVYKSVLPIVWQGEEVLLEAFVDISAHQQVLADQQVLLEEEQRLNRLSIGREMRMIQLKREVNGLLAEMGQGNRYQTVENTQDPEPIEVDP